MHSQPPRRVGRFTVAAGLMAFGIALLADNLLSAHTYAILVLKLWPLLLVGFGLEYLIYSSLTREEGRENRLRFDIGGAIILILIVSLSASIVQVRNWIGSGPNLPITIGRSESVTQTQTVSSDGVKQLHVSIATGSLSLEPSDDESEIRIEASWSVPSWGLHVGAAPTADRFELATREGEIVRVDVVEGGPRGEFGVKLVIFAPPGLTVVADTGAGSIEAKGYDGDLILSSLFGRISVAESIGSLHVTSESGSVTIRDFEGSVTAKSHIGAIKVSNQVGPMELESGTGSVDVTEFQDGSLRATNQTGRIAVLTSAPIAGDLALRTQTGQITLTLPHDSDMAAFAQSGAGSLTLPNFMSLSKTGVGGSGAGTAGNGQHKVELEAGTGSIRFTVR